jgi:hypothetical protein
MTDREESRHGRPRGGLATASRGPRGPPGPSAEASTDAGAARPAGQQGDHRRIEP